MDPLVSTRQEDGIAVAALATSESPSPEDAPTIGSGRAAGLVAGQDIGRSSSLHNPVNSAIFRGLPRSFVVESGCGGVRAYLRKNSGDVDRNQRAAGSIPRGVVPARSKVAATEQPGVPPSLG